MNGFKRLFRFACMTGLFVFAVDSAHGQACYVPEPDSARLIEDCLDEYLGEDVLLEGTAEVFLDYSSPTFAYFLFSDKYGKTILIRTVKEPVLSRKYRLSGRVSTFEFQGREVAMIIESARVWILLERLLWIGIPVLILLLLTAIWFARKPKSKKPPQPATLIKKKEIVVEASNKTEKITVEAESVSGTTFAMNVPTKTLKILGELKFLNGADKNTSIALLVPISDAEPGGAGHEFLIGREKGKQFEYIQLKPATVSRKHAKLSYINGRFMLTNYVPESKNPTLVNGHRMSVGQQVELSAGDVLTFGELELRLGINTQ